MNLDERPGYAPKIGSVDGDRVSMVYGRACPRSYLPRSAGPGSPGIIFRTADTWVGNTISDNPHTYAWITYLRANLFHRSAAARNSG